MTGRLAGAPNRANAKSAPRPPARPILPQDEFAFDAQEFGDAPALLIALGSRERLVDCREPFGNLAVKTEGVRNLAQNWSVKECKRSLRNAGAKALIFPRKSGQV